MATYPIIKPYQDQLNNQQQWTIVAVPSVEWAQQVFPTLPKKAAVDSLWEAILTTARVTDDPIKAWNEHNKNLLDRCNYLNSLNIDYLEYKSENGKDLDGDLIEIVEKMEFTEGLNQLIESIPTRAPTLCAGCSHRSAYYAAVKAYQEMGYAKEDMIFASDIGCYTLGISPPYETADYLLAMGSSVGDGCGFSIATNQHVMSFIGDSTFLPLPVHLSPVPHSTIGRILRHLWKLRQTTTATACTPLTAMSAIWSISQKKVISFTRKKS